VKGSVFYNGANGSLGRYVDGAAKRLGIPAVALKSRLEDSAGLKTELADKLGEVYPGGTATLLQLAAMVSVPGCEKDPSGARKTNVTDTRATVEAFIASARAAKLTPRVIYVSTGHIYAPKAGRLLETDALKPRSVYAETKLEGERALTELCLNERVPLAIARVFGLIAPLQPSHYVLQSVIRRAREKDLTNVPGLSNLRDYLDSRDVCLTLLRLASLPGPADSSSLSASEGHPASGGLPAPAILNICSGEGVEIAYLLETALKELHPSDADSLIDQITEGAARTDDIPEIIGDPSKIERILGRNLRETEVIQTIRDAIAATKLH
jgi:nucleoside-diphosphate-sugar epimerase